METKKKGAYLLGGVFLLGFIIILSIPKSKPNKRNPKIPVAPPASTFVAHYSRVVEYKLPEFSEYPVDLEVRFFATNEGIPPYNDYFKYRVTKKDTLLNINFQKITWNYLKNNDSINIKIKVYKGYEIIKEISYND